LSLRRLEINIFVSRTASVTDGKRVNCVCALGVFFVGQKHMHFTF